MGRFSGPPTSPPDPGPVATHDHEWHTTEDTPILEDGAAHFTEKCEWVEITSAVTSEKHDETFYGTGAECDEVRHFRMELAEVTRLLDSLKDMTIKESAFNRNWGILWKIEEHVASSDWEIVSLDPDRNDGELVVENDDYRLTYRA